MDNSIEKTLEIAKNAHGQTNKEDKGGKSPYHWHLLRVMLRIKDACEEEKQVAILHDILEDTKLNKEDLLNLGFSKSVVDCVVWCSKNYFPQHTFVQWMQAIAKDAPDMAVKVKLADIFDNLGFERMRGLRLGSLQKQRDKLNTSNTKALTKEDFYYKKTIEKKTNKKMTLVGEMGVYDRYYKALEIILKEEKNLSLLSTVIQEDFCSWNNLQQLSCYLSKEEQSNYLNYQGIHTWKLNGIGKIIKDRVGNDYLAVDVPSNNYEMYEKYLQSQGLNQLINNKLTRDKGFYHITIINAAQWNMLKKNEKLSKEIIEDFCDKEWSFFSYGIGKAQKDNSQTLFSILENSYLSTLREKYELGSHDFHMTLGFEPKDIFGVDKSRKSVVFNNTEIWQWAVDNYLPELKPSSLKLKF